MEEPEYWEKNTPMSFIPEGWTYEQKREFRFKTIPYLQEAAGFDLDAGVDGRRIWR